MKKAKMAMNNKTEYSSTWKILKCMSLDFFYYTLWHLNDYATKPDSAITLTAHFFYV